jgi:hypothetical protein
VSSDHSKSNANRDDGRKSAPQANAKQNTESAPTPKDGWAVRTGGAITSELLAAAGLV